MQIKLPYFSLLKRMKMTDKTIKFSAPRFYDFVDGETEADTLIAEGWFSITNSYPPSPFLLRKEASRTDTAESLCEFNDIQAQKNSYSSKIITTKSLPAAKHQSEFLAPESKEVDICRTEAKAEQKTNHTDGVSRSLLVVVSPSIAQENQAIKRQKLDDCKSRQIVHPKQEVLPHKSKLSVASTCSSSTNNKISKNKRKVYVKEPTTTFVSMGEMVKKFQSSTRELLLPHAKKSTLHRSKLKLTRPEEPDVQTVQGVCSVKSKNEPELNEEVMAKIPKFKARPAKQKVLKASILTRSTTQQPQFRNSQWKPQHTTPKSPLFHTSIRARPPRVKSSLEEELENIPKFKARPLNKKIFECKGGMGIFSSLKKDVTKPKEFQFATDQRTQQTGDTFDAFDKRRGQGWTIGGICSTAATHMR